MNTVFTPPVDQPVDEPAGIFDPLHDEREPPFVLQTHPRGNGELDERDTAYSRERWDAVLGW